MGYGGLSFEELEEDYFDDVFDEEFEDEYFDEDAFDVFAEEESMYDEEEEDEFVGALAGLAAQALPSVAKKVVPQVMKWGKRVFRAGTRDLKRAAPKIIQNTVRSLARSPRNVRMNPLVVKRMLNKKSRPYIRRYRRYPGKYACRR
ncbi:MAG: hypothetical protein E3K37_00220 [Candidatus Kuenenia sp.]|nr:hypothetical protein [Candidatus Kuenenia hertensis]